MYSPNSEGGLEEGDDAGDEHDRGDDVAAGGVVLLDAERRAQDERDRDRRAEHGQVMLRFNSLVISQILISCFRLTHLQAEEDAHVPGGHVVDAVDDVGVVVRDVVLAVVAPDLHLEVALLVVHPISAVIVTLQGQNGVLGNYVECQLEFD